MAHGSRLMPPGSWSIVFIGHEPWAWRHETWAKNHQSLTSNDSWTIRLNTIGLRYSKVRSTQSPKTTKLDSHFANIIISKHAPTFSYMFWSILGMTKWIDAGLQWSENPETLGMLGFGVPNNKGEILLEQNGQNKSPQLFNQSPKIAQLVFAFVFFWRHSVFPGYVDCVPDEVLWRLRPYWVPWRPQKGSRNE